MTDDLPTAVEVTGSAGNRTPNAASAALADEETTSPNDLSSNRPLQPDAANSQGEAPQQPTVYPRPTEYISVTPQSQLGYEDEAEKPTTVAENNTAETSTASLSTKEDSLGETLIGKASAGQNSDNTAKGDA